MIAAIVAVVLMGSVPSDLEGPSTAAWVSEGQHDVICSLLSPARWECRDVSDPPRGIVVIVGATRLAYQPVGIAHVDGDPQLRRWGRLIVFTPGGVAPEDVTGLRVTAWRPERAPLRARARRLAPVEQPAVDSVQISDHAFWIAGNALDPDAFLSVEGPTIATSQVRAADFADGPPDVPFFVPLEAPRSLVGRVQTRRGEDVEGAEIDLFAPVAAAVDEKSGIEGSEVVRRARVQSGFDGGFQFERLTTGPFLVIAVHGELGRAAAVIKSVADPVVVTLVAPVRVQGRILRSGLPTPGVRVRFVPNATALTTSTDAKDVLSEERLSRDNGRFELPLPPVHDGMIQMLSPDGAALRIAVPEARADNVSQLGDVSLPDPRTLTVRVIDPVSCTLTAAGPLGGLGLTMVQASAWGNEYRFDLPEAGQWALSAECTGRPTSIEPSVVAVPDRGPTRVIEIRVAKPPPFLDPP